MIINNISDRQLRTSFLLSLSILVAWIAFGAAHSTAYWRDSVEQFNWAHSAELGYWKHPPLSTWLLIAFQQLFGKHLYDTHVLSFACLSLTFYLYWKIAESLVGKNLAIFAVFFLGLNFAFSRQAQLYNHNTVLTLLVSCVVWVSLRLEQKEDPSWVDWALVGATSALAMLAKYQAAIAIIGIVSVIVFSKKFTFRELCVGMLAAIFTGLLIFLPHLYWVIDSDFLILKYSTHAVQNNAWIDRFLNLLSFFGQQARDFLLILIAGIILVCSFRYGKNHSGFDQEEYEFENPQRSKIWFAGLLFFPVMSAVILNQVFQVRLMNHWGMELLLFFPMWFVYYLRKSIATAKPARLLGLIIILHALSMVEFSRTAVVAAKGPLTDNSRVRDILYPAEKLTTDGLTIWKTRTNCPLRFVGGEPFQAGLISIYSGEFPTVFESTNIENLQLTPWVQRNDLLRDGALIVYPANQSGSRVNFEVIEPDHTCT